MQTLSRAAWLAAGRLAGDALAFCLFVLIAREFGPEGLGLYALNYAIASILYELVSLGIEDYGAREYARRDVLLRGRLLASLFGAQLLLTLVIGAAVTLIGIAFGSPHLPLLGCLVLYQLAFAIARTLFIPAFVAGWVLVQVVAETVARAAALGVALLMVRFAYEPGLAPTLVGLPIFALLLLLVSLASARRFAGLARAEVSQQSLRDLLAALWPFVATNLASRLYTRTAVIVLFTLAGGVEAGLFASAYKLAELGWALLILLPAAAYPLLARVSHADPASFRRLATGLIGATLLVGGVFAWGTYSIAPPLATRLFGPEFAAAAPLLRMLAACIAIVALNEVLDRLLLAADLQRRRLEIATMQVVANFALALLLVPRFGAAGAVTAFIAAQLAATGCGLWALRAQLDWRGFTQSIARWQSIARSAR